MKLIGSSLTQTNIFLIGTLTSRVRWHTNQPDVIEINGIFSEAGIEYDEHDSISVRLKALNPGTAKIQAEFTTTSGSHLCNIEITVFKLLELEQPRHISSDVIIVPPRSKVVDNDFIQMLSKFLHAQQYSMISDQFESKLTRCTLPCGRRHKWCWWFKNNCRRCASNQRSHWT